MSYPRLKLVASVFLIGASFAVSAADYDIRLHDTIAIDHIGADGYCSIAEAVAAINLQRGVTGGPTGVQSVLGEAYWGLSVTNIDSDPDESSVDGGYLKLVPDGILNVARTVRNVTRDASAVPLGTELKVKDNDVVEFAITFSAVGGAAFDPSVSLVKTLDEWSQELGYRMSYVAGSAKLNDKALAGNATNPLPGGVVVRDEEAAEGTNTITAGNRAILTFRVTVSGVGKDNNGKNNERLFGAECPAGGVSNVLRFATVPVDSDDEAPVYELGDELVIGTSDASALTVSFQFLPDDVFDTNAGNKKNFILKSAPGSRILTSGDNTTIKLSGADLFGSREYDEISDIWTCQASVNGDGALLHISGSLEADLGTRFVGGCAVGDGGAIYVADRQRSLTLSSVMFEHNYAGGNGGAIATSGLVSTPQPCTNPDNDPVYCDDPANHPAPLETAFSGILSLEKFHFLGNEAAGNGGAIHLDGVRSGLSALSGTFFRNLAGNNGGAVYAAVHDDQRSLIFNNISIVANEAASGAGGLYLSPLDDWDPAEDIPVDIIANSVIVGNAPVDCASDTSVYDALDESTLIVYSASDQTCGPHEDGDSHDFNRLPPHLATDPVMAFGMDALRGLNGDCAAGEQGSTVTCEPFGGSNDADNGPLIYFLPKLAFDPVTQEKVWPSLVAAASPAEGVTYVCGEDDIRGKDRISQCDIGAAQLRIARGEIDEFKVIQGIATPIDVLANDIGDLDVDCGVLSSNPLDPDACISFPKLPREASIPRVIIGPATFEYLARIGVNETEYKTITIPAGYPMVIYQAFARSHGVDDFRYAVNREAIIGETTTSYGPSAQVNVVIEPPKGLSKKEDITDLGFYGWALLLSMLLSLRKLKIGAGASIVLLLFPVFASAAELRVTTHLDYRSPGDAGYDASRCSLRQAIDSTIDGSPAWYPACGTGATGADQIIVPAFCELEHQTNGTTLIERCSVFEAEKDDRYADYDLSAAPEVPYVLLSMLEVSPDNRVEIIGEGVGKTIIQGNGTTRLFDLRSRVTFANLTLAEGYLPGVPIGGAVPQGAAIQTNSSLALINVELRDNQSTGNGGVIYLNYLGGASGPRELSIANSYIHGNTAGGKGAVISMTGQTSAHKINIENSTFFNNTSSDSSLSSVFAVNMFSGGVLNSTNSTYFDNGADVLFDLTNTHENVGVFILNNTFKGQAQLFNHPGGSGPKVHVSHSILADVAACLSAGALETAKYNIFDVALGATDCGALTDDGNQDLPVSAYQAALGGFAQLAGEQAYSAVEDTYVPPHFPVFPGAVGAELILDQGSDAALAGGTSTPASCRDRDLRGVSRTSGGACDIGAYELNVPTAQSDSASSSFRMSREVQLDVLLNDSLGDGLVDIDGVVQPNTALSDTLVFADEDDATDPDAWAWQPSAAGAELTAADGKKVAAGNLMLVQNGTWRYDHSSTVLTEGAHTVQAVIYNPDDVAVVSTYQRIVVRESGEKRAGDNYVANGTSMLRISAISEDALTGEPLEGEFVSRTGRIIVSGYSDLPEGWEVRIFVDADEVADNIRIERGPAASCGTTGNAGCIARVEFVEFGGADYNPATDLDLEKQCSWINAGLSLKKAYRYQVADYQGNVFPNPATYATFVATISNQPPVFSGSTRKSSAGQTVVFDDFDPRDDDGVIRRELKPATPESDGRRISPVKLSAAPKFAAIDRATLGGRIHWVSFGLIDANGDGGPVLPDGSIYNESNPAQVSGVGLVLDLRDNTITYRPQNVQQEFNDTFSFAVEDDCGLTASAQFKVEYPNQGRTQGLAGLLLLMMLVSLGCLRRRKHRL